MGGLAGGGAELRVMVVNVGSSSLRLRLLGHDDELVAARDFPAEDHAQALADFLHAAPSYDAVGHRVVHGGTQFRESVAVTDDVLERLQGTAALAPLHNPPAIAAIREMRRLAPGTPNVACFDTAFHVSLSDAAALYALPESWNALGLRRFGFHGLSYAYASRRAAELLKLAPDEPRLVICHLGAGASVAAVAGGRSRDTTMGFTPLEGLVMATRSGSVDPGLLLWLQRRREISAEEMEGALEHESGLAGLTGRSGDMRELLAAVDAGDDRARTALAVYLHRLRATIAAMAAALGGLDALVFTGAVGEGSDRIRTQACEGLAFLGVAARGTGREEASGHDEDVSAEGASVRVLVIHAREDLEIAAQARRVLSA
jgi:acetate kinase